MDTYIAMGVEGRRARAETNFEIWIHTTLPLYAFEVCIASDLGFGIILFFCMSIWSLPLSGRDSPKAKKAQPVTVRLLLRKIARDRRVGTAYRDVTKHDKQS